MKLSNELRQIVDRLAETKVRNNSAAVYVRILT